MLIIPHRRHYRRHYWCAALLIFLAVSAVMVSPAVLLASEEMTDLTELSLEDLMKVTIYGASRYEQKISEAPASVTVITADEIRKYGYRTMNDILRSVRGLYVSDDHNYSYVGFRGFNRAGDYNSRVLILIDGHRINDAIYDSGLIGTEFPLDIDLIEKMEIIRGPSSSLYGTSAFFGVINITTRKAEDLKGGEISGAVGSDDTYQGRLSYGGALSNGMEMMLSGSYYTSDGERKIFFSGFDDPANNNGVAEDVDGDKKKSFFARLRFHNFTLEGLFSSREKEIPTGSFGTVFNDPNNETTDERGYLFLRYAHTFNDHHEITGGIFYDFYNYRGKYVYDWAEPGDPPSLVLNKDYAWDRSWGGEVYYTGQLPGRQKFTAGMEYRSSYRQDQKNYDEGILVNLDDKQDSTLWAVFIQDEVRILNNLLLNVGIRHDHYSTFGGSTNPRIALIYSPYDQTTFKLLYGSAFRAPNVYELYYNDNRISQKSNPSLDPETIKTYELVYEQSFGRNLRSSVSGFLYSIDNLISQGVDPADGFIVFNNSDEVEARGVEMEISGKWERGIEGRISYTYVEAKDKKTDQTLTNSPRHLATLNMIIPLIREKLFSALDVQYTSRRKTLQNRYTGGFGLFNLTLFSRHVIKGVDISAGLYNIFNKKYKDPSAEEHQPLVDSIPQDGRSFRLKFVYSF